MNKKTVSKFFDHVAYVYDETRVIPDSVIQKAFSLLNDKINLNEHRIVLDVGIGTGRTSRFLSQYNIELTGIDISSKMLRKCLERNRDKISVGKLGLIQGDITRLPFKSSTFDITTAMHVLEFTGKEPIEDIKRVIKPGGFLIILSYTNPMRANIIAKKYDDLHRKYSARTKERLIWICKNLIPASIFEKVLGAIDEKKRFSYFKKSATSFQTEKIFWTQRVQASQILNILEKRIYSQHYATPDKTHNRIMNELKKWIEKKGIGTFDEVECSFDMEIIKF